MGFLWKGVLPVKHLLRNSIAALLTLSLCLALISCGQKSEPLTLPFAAEDVSAAEVFFRENHADWQKKQLTDAQDIQLLWEKVNSLPIQKENTYDSFAEPENPREISFRFYLENENYSWLLAYDPLGVKAGALYPSELENATPYFTRADVPALWDLFDVPAVAAVPDELPFAQ